MRRAIDSACCATTRTNSTVLPTNEAIPRYFLVQLAAAYTVPELRKIAHNMEIEAFVAEQFDEPVTGYLEWLADVYAAAIDYRRAVDELRALRHPLASHARGNWTDFKTIKERTDVVEYIGRYVKLRKAGRAYKGLCAFHNEKTPSFYVWPEIKGWRCFGCGAKGDVITFATMVGDASLFEVER